MQKLEDSLWGEEGVKAIRLRSDADEHLKKLLEWLLPEVSVDNLMEAGQHTFSIPSPASQALDNLWLCSSKVLKTELLRRASQTRPTVHDDIEGPHRVLEISGTGNGRPVQAHLWMPVSACRGLVRLIRMAWFMNSYEEALELSRDLRDFSVVATLQPKDMTPGLEIYAFWKGLRNEHIQN